ncbi:MAG: PIN domain-containing protein [Gemmatimonadetes bacterium]|nr:PIN domain-containing protein [Gemmatimonadota bacterium]
MKCILDTHFLLWIVLDAPRLDEFPWLQEYRPWGVSPVSFLEIQFLAEAGRLTARTPEFTDAVLADERFVVDEVPLLLLIRYAVDVDWTRDPFDRLIVAHSAARRSPLCTVDRGIRERHTHLPAELRAG